jgi:hypothetical protein
MSHEVNQLMSKIRQLTAERDALQLSVLELAGELKRITGKSALPAGMENGDSPSLKFDPEWYLDYYEDVVQLGMDPLEHYNWIGQRLGRAPNQKALKKNAAKSLAGFWQTLR